ncbi:MAG: M23 family metallopeptidase [Leptospirales bacterium]
MIIPPISSTTSREKKKRGFSFLPHVVICDSNPSREAVIAESKKLMTLLVAGISSFLIGMILIVFVLISEKRTIILTATSIDKKIAVQHGKVFSIYVRLSEIHQRIERLTLRERLIGEIINPSRSFRKSLSGFGGNDHWLSPSKFWAGRENAVPVFMNHVDKVIHNEQILLSQREGSLHQLVALLEEQKMRWLRIPSILPVRGVETSGFGWRNSPFGGRREFHPGIDIAGKIGTPVIATAGGTVIWSGWNGGFGKTVKIRHVDGIVTLFGHLSHSFVHLGEEVHRGQVVAAVGNTGLSTGPHLHYEILVHQQPVNPKKYFLIDLPYSKRYAENHQRF